MAKHDSAKSHLMLARIADKEKQFAEAENQSSWRSVKRKTRRPNIGCSWPIFIAQRGRLDDMQKAVQTAMAQPNKPAETYFDAANELYLGNRDFPDAVHYLQKVSVVRSARGRGSRVPRPLPAGPVEREAWGKSGGGSEYQASLALASGFRPARKALDQLQ